MLQVNGTERDASGLTVAALLEQEGFLHDRVAVERNGDIVPRARYADTVLQDGDSVEIVRFVGGG
ncbi:MAG TPA: sulfur carrier protein ThiS [Candidatus Avidesulfovibrio excrementigallinarum]|nr:sulfur carrier protein ThiS [Candidatus Avidesulfovibrio excrementigallinarum]